METYEEEYHILSRDKGEAILSAYQKVKMKEMLGKYFKEDK